MTKEKCRKLLRIQRIAGLCLMAICLIVVFMASKGTTVEDRDILPVLFFLPWALALLFGRSVMIPEDADEVVEDAAKAVKREVKFFVADSIDFIESKIK